MIHRLGGGKMRLTIRDIQNMKQRGEAIPMLTAYDYTSAQIVDRAGVPMILVGDSLGQVVLGYDSTVAVTMDEMLHHTKAVVRGSQHAMIIGDLPFMSYHLSISQALNNAGRFLQEAGAQAVKLEGGLAVSEIVRAIVECGIPVMGHIGLTPQSVHQLGGYRVQGKTLGAAKKLLEDASTLEEAGVFAIVLEGIPTPLAKLITDRASVPTIGIGAGRYCDGQVQVFHDMMGLFSDFVPKHAKRFTNLADSISVAISEYTEEIKDGIFPEESHSYSMDDKVVQELIENDQ